jgi:hypothetical protein
LIRDKAEKEFVESWDRMMKAWDGEAELERMREQVSELAQKQTEFDERLGRLLLPRE